MKFKILLTLFLLIFSRALFAHSGGVWVANDGCGHWFAIVFHYHGGSGSSPTASNASAGLYIDFNQNGKFDVNGQQYEYTNASGFAASNGEFNRFTNWINLTDKYATASAYAKDVSIQNEVLNWLNTNKNYGKNYSLTVVTDGGAYSDTWYEALVVPIRPLSPGIYKGSTSTSSAVETPIGYSNPFNINYTPSNFIGTISSQSSCGQTLNISTTLTQTCVQEYGVVYSTTNKLPAIGGAGVSQQSIWSGAGTDMSNQSFDYTINVPGGNEYLHYYARAYYKQQVGSDIFYVYSPLIDAVPLDPTKDCDNDGINNGIETAQQNKDTDGDGTPDFKDVDSDGDGISDNVETASPDCDADGIRDFQDLSLAPEIKSQPVNSTICAGNNTSFSVTVTGGGLSYQWQVNDGTGFRNISNDAIYSGATTNKLNLVNPTSGMSGYKYKCIVNSSTCSTSSSSNEATLIVNFTNAPTVTNASYYVGDKASDLSVNVSNGTNLLWYSSLTAGEAGVSTAPTPPTDRIGSQDFWVTQTLEGCESAKAKITVTINPANEIAGTSTSKKAYYKQATIVDDQIVVTGKEITNAKVYIQTGFQRNDVLSVGTLPAGINSAYNSVTGSLTFTGTATAAQWQEIFRNIKFSSTSQNTGDRTIKFILGDAVGLTVGGKSHYYLYVRTNSSISWTAARDAASSKTFFGLQGYLATSTSQAENDFIKEKLSSDGWIGGSDNTQAISNASEGNWYWATGPEKGAAISRGNNSPVSVNGAYMNWNPGEPNNSGEEDFMQLYSYQNGKWNDLPDNPGSIFGYVVEFGGYDSDPVLNIESSRTFTYYKPATPSKPVLTDGRNGYINDATPTITGAAEPNVQVHIYEGNVFVADVTAGEDGSWSYTFTTALSDGVHNVYVDATDILGYISEQSEVLAFTVDTQAPVKPSTPVLAGGNDGNISDSTPSVSGTAEANSLVTIYSNGVVLTSVTADAQGSWNYTFNPAVTDGAYALAVTSTDAAGNVSEQSEVLAFTVDTQAPVKPSTPVLAGGNDGNISDSTPSVSGTAEANSLVTIYSNGVVLTSVTADAQGSWNYTFNPAVTDGAYALAVTSTDAAGNVSEQSDVLAFTVDTQAPAGYSVAFGSSTIDVTNVSNATVNITEAEVGTALFYSIGSNNGGSPVSGNIIVSNGSFDLSNLDLTGLEDGQLTVTVYLQDKAGNRGGNVTAQVMKYTRNIASVAIPENIKVPIRTTFSQVQLPSTVEVTYATGVKDVIGVNWKQGDFNGLVAGTYELIGELVLAPNTFNLDNKVASIRVEVEPNKVPTALLFSATSFKPEASANEVIGTLSTTDPDDTEFIYEFVSGDGDKNNDLFEIRNDKVFLKSNKGLSGLTQFTIRVRSTDPYNNAIEKTFTLSKTGYSKEVVDLKLVNAFSPNGDGVNDTWIVPELRFYNQVMIEVFDRSGVRIFQTTNPEKGWDGRNQHGQVLEGSYLYIIQIKDISFVKKGTVTVIKKR